MASGSSPSNSLAAQWVLLALILSLGMMKPAIALPILLTDVIFVLLVVVVVSKHLLRGQRIEWRREHWILLLYPVSLMPSLLATPQLGLSLLKLSTIVYLVGLALVTSDLVRSEAMLRRAVCAWLAATAVIALIALASLAAFLISPDNALLDYSRFHFGTLPPGNYPRLAVTFFNANMLANYLTVSLGLLAIAWQRKWLSGRTSALLFAGIGVAAISTLSPGLGGIALAIGLWIWLFSRGTKPAIARISLALGLTAAMLFLLATAITPIVHPTAPFLLDIPGTGVTLAPAGRFLTWSGAAAEFARHPLIGHGIGVDATSIRYLSPSGEMQTLTDAHNFVLNIAAQSGLVGVAGLIALLFYVVRMSLPWRVDAGGSGVARVGLGLIFLNAFVYQGLAGSYEDARHLWVLLGLLIAAARLDGADLIRADENNRRAGGPSPC